MDAADAARMSDPALNPHFRRRWTEPPDAPACVLTPALTTESPEASGVDLLERWRRERRGAEACPR